jgi:hypothetical protein
MIEKLIAMVFIVFLPVGAAVVGGSDGQPSDADFDPSHALFGKVLESYVRAGKIDYAGLQRDPGDLKAYLDQLASVSSNEFKTWSEPEQLAFLVNLYNAATLQLIIEHYPVETIRDIGSLWKGPWKQAFVRLFGEEVTLDHIEHDLIRKDYDEPRIHFALVCAARSCPPLRSEPYLPARLEEQFEEQGRVFLNAPSKNRVDVEERTVLLSKIFKWFSKDFEDQAGSILAFVRPYFPEETARRMKEEAFEVEYLDYDWSLNDQKASGP